MFIERATRKKFFLAPAEPNISRSRVPYAENCAPPERELMTYSVIYKHLAPLEPEHRLVTAFLRCISVVAKRPGNTHHGDTEDA